MNRKFSLLLWAIVLPTAAYAVRFVPLSVQELTAQSEVIIHGAVRERVVERDASGRVYTKVQITVAETWKGRSGAELTVVQASGTLGERTYHADGEEPLEPGEEVVLFLVMNDRKQGVVVGLCQGKFQVRANAKVGEKVVCNLFHGRNPQKPLKLGELKSKVKGGQP